jgi:hypothetical protein
VGQSNPQQLDNWCAQLHFYIRKEEGLNVDNEHWYQNVSKLVGKSHEGKVTIPRNQEVQTKRSSPKNKLDIRISDNETEMFMLIDTSLKGDRNVIMTEATKILKYIKRPQTEILYMWNVKIK